MKIIVDIMSYRYGVHNDSGEDRSFVFIRGHSADGIWTKAAMCDTPAEKLNAALMQSVEEGKEISESDLFVELFGAWKDGPVQKSEDGAPVLDDAGKVVRERHFIADRFHVLQGPALEMLRLKRDSRIIFREALAKHSAGDVEGAYVLMHAFTLRCFGEAGSAGLEEHLDVANDEKVALAIFNGDGKPVPAAPVADAGDAVKREANSIASTPSFGFGAAPAAKPNNQALKQDPFDTPKQEAVTETPKPAPAFAGFGKPSFGKPFSAPGK